MANYSSDYKSVSVPAGADISAYEYCCVKMDTSGRAVVGTAGDAAFGVLLAGGNTALPDAAGEIASVGYQGIMLVRAGATITTPGQVEVTTGGEVIPLNTGVAVGWAMSAAAENDIIPVRWGI